MVAIFYESHNFWRICNLEPKISIPHYGVVKVV